MNNASKKERILDFFANNPGTRQTAEIAEAIGTSVSSASTTLGVLTTEGKITKIQRGIYSGNDAGVSIDAQTRPDDARKKISRKGRFAEDNAATISELLNEYDDLFKEWIADKGADFEERLQNFKWLTAIGDKLMKRWSLEHVGYDTNARLAQEDAKAKTEARQKEALEGAPVEEQVTVIGSFDLETKQLIDNFPTLEDLSEAATEEITV